MSSFNEVINEYESSVPLKEIKEQSYLDSNFKRLLRQMKQKQIKKGSSEKIKRQNNNMISSNDIIDSLKILKDEIEFYNLPEGCNTRLKLKTSQKISDTPRVDFFERCPDGLKNRISIYAGESEGQEFIFKTDNLYLAPGRCLFSIKTSNKVLIKDLKLNIHSGDRGIPSKSVFEDKENPNSSFPDGNFLLLDTRIRKDRLEKEGKTIIHNRKILRNVQEGIMYKKGSKDKKINGKAVWRLIKG